MPNDHLASTLAWHGEPQEPGFKWGLDMPEKPWENADFVLTKMGSSYESKGLNIC